MYFVSDQHLLAKENENNIGADFAYKKTFHTTIMFVTHPKSKCESLLKMFLATQKGSEYVVTDYLTKRDLMEDGPLIHLPIHVEY